MSSYDFWLHEKVRIIVQNHDAVAEWTRSRFDMVSRTPHWELLQECRLLPKILLVTLSCIGLVVVAEEVDSLLQGMWGDSRASCGW